jgi:hypothetical protein
MALTIQRRLQLGNMSWSDWEDVDLPYHPPVDTPTQLREKPVFKPGFFTNGDKRVEWWDTDPKLNYGSRNWLRVEVTVVDPD